MLCAVDVLSTLYTNARPHHDTQKPVSQQRLGECDSPQTNYFVVTSSLTKIRNRPDTLDGIATYRVRTRKFQPNRVNSAHGRFKTMRSLASTQRKIINHLLQSQTPKNSEKKRANSEETRPNHRTASPTCLESRTNSRLWTFPSLFRPPNTNLLWEKWPLLHGSWTGVPAINRFLTLASDFVALHSSQSHELAGFWKITLPSSTTNIRSQIGCVHHNANAFDITNRHRTCHRQNKVRIFVIFKISVCPLCCILILCLCGFDFFWPWTEISPATTQMCKTKRMCIVRNRLRNPILTILLPWAENTSENCRSASLLWTQLFVTHVRACNTCYETKRNKIKTWMTRKHSFPWMMQTAVKCQRTSWICAQSVQCHVPWYATCSVRYHNQTRLPQSTSTPLAGTTNCNKPP